MAELILFFRIHQQWTQFSDQNYISVEAEEEVLQQPVQHGLHRLVTARGGHSGYVPRVRLALCCQLENIDDDAIK